MENTYNMATVFTKKDFNFSCIYKLTSPSGKIYIGQAQTMYLRFRDYRRPRATKYLKRAILKYGLENMTVEILEKDVPLELLDEREQFYLDTLQPFKNNGYNICKEASTTRGTKKSEEEKIAMSERAKLRIGELNPFYGRVHSDETKQQQKEVKLGKKQSKNTVLKRVKKITKCIKQIDLITRGVIAEFESIREASIVTGINARSISNVANKIKNIQENETITYSAGGYLWIHCDSELPDVKIETGRDSTYKCVKQIDLLSGEVIAEFKSIKEASLITNISYNGISKVARKCEYFNKGKKFIYKSSGGFYWEF